MNVVVPGEILGVAPPRMKNQLKQVFSSMGAVAIDDGTRKLGQLLPIPFSGTTFFASRCDLFPVFRTRN